HFVTAQEHALASERESLRRSSAYHTNPRSAANNQPVANGTPTRRASEGALAGASGWCRRITHTDLVRGEGHANSSCIVGGHLDNSNRREEVGISVPRSHALRGNACPDALRRGRIVSARSFGSAALGTQSVRDGIPTQSVGTRNHFSERDLWGKEVSL